MHIFPSNNRIIQNDFIKMNPKLNHTLESQCYPSLHIFIIFLMNNFVVENISNCPPTNWSCVNITILKILHK